MHLEPEQHDVNDNSLRVMTFNLLTSTKKSRSHPWRLRRRNIARLVGDLAPDVLGTQEANQGQLQDLAARLPEYSYVGEGNLGRSRADSDTNWYCATFYRRDRVRPVPGEPQNEAIWLSPTPDVPASQYNLGTRPRLVTWSTFEVIDSGRLFVFGTTHLEAVNPWHRQRSARQLQEHVARKVEVYGPDVPVFLTGDFNAVAGSPEIRGMRERSHGREPLFDAWSEAGGSEKDGATFRGLGLRDRMGHLLMGPRRIDYVFFRPQLTVRSVNRIDYSGMEHREAALPSDHFPVLAEFDLAG